MAMTLRQRVVGFGLLMGIAFAANGADFKYENKPENLKALLELVHQTVHVKKDNRGATALFAGMIPSSLSDLN